MSGENGKSEFKHLNLNFISFIVRLGAYFFLEEEGRVERPDFIRKHHASGSKTHAAWCMRTDAGCASKTNFQIGQLAVGHEVPLRGTFLIQPKDQAANLSEVLAWSFSLKAVLQTAYIFDVFPGHYYYQIPMKEKTGFSLLFARLFVTLAWRRSYSHSEKQRKNGFFFAFRSFNRNFARF